MSAREFDDNGWYEVQGNPLSKVGVYPYLGAMIDPNGTLGLDSNAIYSVYRSASELSSKATIDSFKLLPWIDDHEILGNDDDSLTPAEEKGIAGAIGETVYFEDGTLFGNIKVWSGDLADKIDAGKRELSCGYRCEYELREGIFGDQEYSLIQTNIRGNHLASVDEGRMGPDVAVLDHLKFTVDSKELTLMAKPAAITLDELLLKKDNSPKLRAALKLVAAALDGDDEEKSEDTEEDEEEETKSEDKYDEDKDDDEEKSDDEDMEEDEDEDKKKSDDEDDDEEMSEDMGSHGEDSAKALRSVRSELRQVKKSQARDRRDADKRVLRSIAKRDELYAKVSEHIGSFDHAEMTVGELALYACKKLGLKTTKGHETSALDGFFWNRRPASAFGQDTSQRAPLGRSQSGGASADYFKGSKK